MSPRTEPRKRTLLPYVRTPIPAGTWRFADFVDCAEHLVSEGVTSPKGLAVCGRSAGGLLIGNVVNMRPDLFAAAVADVPFVDLMNSVSDCEMGG